MEEQQRRRRAALEGHSTTVGGGERPDRRESSGSHRAGLFKSATVANTKESLSAAVSWLGSKMLSSSGSEAQARDPDNLDGVEDAAAACAALRRALDVKKELQVVAALDVMTDLAEKFGRDMILALGSGGACASIDQILNWRGSSSSSIAESGLRAFCSLVQEEALRRRIVSGGACYRIVKIIQLNLQDEIVVEWGLRVLRYLALDESSLSKLSSSGVCELVSLVLNTYNVSNDDIVLWSCRIIYSMTSDESNQEKFSCGEACEAIVVGVLQERPSTVGVDVAMWSLRAIGGLARKNAGIKNRLANLGACELTLHLFNSFGFQDATFAESFCWAVGNLAFPDEIAQGRLAASGACIAVVEALELHMNIPEMAQEGFRAIRNLGHLHEANLFALSDAGACDVVMRAIKIHSKTGMGGGVLQWGWYAVASLSDRSENLRVFGAAGACQELVQSFSRFVSSPEIVQWACLAVAKLAQDADISKYIGHEGACRSLVQVLSIHQGNSEVVEECFNAIGALCSHVDNTRNRDIFEDAGIADALIKTMMIHEREEFVSEQACWALSRIVAGGEKMFLQKIVAAGVCKVLPKIVAKFCENEKSCEHGCQIISVLSMQDIDVLSRLGTGGAPAAVVSALARFPSSTEVSRWSLQAICNLCSNEECLAKLRSADAPATIFLSLQANHAISEETSCLALQALNALSREEACRHKLAGIDGMVEVVISCLNIYFESTVVAKLACNLIVELSRSNFQTSQASSSTGLKERPAVNFIAFSDSTFKFSIAERFGNAGIAEIIYGILDRFRDNCEIIAVCCRSIEALCASDDSRGKFGRVGVFELFVEILQSLPKDGAPNSAICLAVTALLEEGKSKKDNQQLLVELNMASHFSSLIVNNADNPAVFSSCCKATSLLASDNSFAQKQLLDCGVLDGIVSILRRYLDNEFVVVHACLAIAELALNNSENSAEFGRLGVCKDLVSALLRHKKSELVCEACCRAIFSLKELNTLLGGVGACEAVLPILAQHPASEAVAQWVCRAIGSLAENQSNKKILGASSACEVIIAALQRHVANETLLSVVLMRNTSSAGVAQWGCAAIYFLARGSGKLEEEYRRKLVAAGACEAVAKALVKYSEVEAVAHSCCRAVVVIVEGKEREEFAARLGNLGVCSTVVDSLHLFPSSIPVAKWGCRAVAVLAECFEGNVGRLVAAGCCEVVPVAMQAHQTSEAVAGAGCDALTSLAANSSSGYAARLGHTGACESVVSVLRRHSSNADVIERGCRAMANLALVKGNSSWFGPAGACDALLRVQRLHPSNESLAAAAWLAAGSLCIDDNNKHRLGQAGACEQSVESMRTLLLFPAVARAAGTAIGKVLKF